MRYGFFSRSLYFSLSVIDISLANEVWILMRAQGCGLQ